MNETLQDTLIFVGIVLAVALILAICAARDGSIRANRYRQTLGDLLELDPVLAEAITKHGWAWRETDFDKIRRLARIKRRADEAKVNTAELDAFVLSLELARRAGRKKGASS